MKMTKYQLAKERNRIRAEAEREKDMVYFVKFQKKGCGYPLQFFPIVDQLASDPTQNPATLERAIKTFESREKIADWREIADSYECGKYWYG
jgi:hypothetical protein